MSNLNDYNNFYTFTTVTVTYGPGSSFFNFELDNTLLSDPDVENTKLALDMLNDIGVKCK